MLHAYESPSVFVDNVGMALGEADLDILTNNTILLDALSFRAPPITSSSAGKDTSTPHFYVGTGQERIWRGSFLMQAGMTDLDIEGWAQKGASENFQFFIDGIFISSMAVPNGTTWSANIDISGLTVDAVHVVTIQIDGTGYAGASTSYRIYDAYVSPVVTSLTWPGVPTFSGTYSATKLNQLAAAQAYLAERLNAVPLIPFMASYYAHGSSVTGDQYPLWFGAIERANGANTLNIRILPLVLANVAEHYEVVIESGVEYSSASLTVGNASDDYLSIDISGFTADQRLEARIYTYVDTGPAAGPSGDRNSRYHLWAIRTTNDTPAVISTPHAFTANESMSSTTLDGHLNALSTALDDVKTRLDAHPRIFNRVELMRRPYGRNAEQWAVFAEANTYAARFVRAGSRLIVSGKNVKVGWGPISTKAEKTTTTTYKTEFAHTMAIIDGESYQTKVVYLDALPDLRRGQAYAVIGEDVWYASEWLL